MNKLLAAILMLNLAIFSGSALAQGGHGKADEKSKGKGHGYGHTKDHASDTGLANGRGHYGHHECMPEELEAVLLGYDSEDDSLATLQLTGTLCDIEDANGVVTETAADQYDNLFLADYAISEFPSGQPLICAELSDSNDGDSSVFSEDSVSVDVIFECFLPPPA